MAFSAIRMAKTARDRAAVRCSPTTACLALIILALPPLGTDQKVTASDPRLQNERQVFDTEDEAWRLSRTTSWPMMRISPDGSRLLYLRHLRGENERAEYALTLRDLETRKDSKVPVPPVPANWANIYPRINPFDPAGERTVLTLFERDGGVMRSRIMLWTVGEESPVETGLGGSLWVAKFHRTGQHLIINKQIEMATASAPRFELQPLGITGVLWSSCPTADVIALYRPGSGRGAVDSELILYDVENRKELSELPLEGRGSQLDDLETPWTTNGRYLYYPDVDGTRVWDREAGELTATVGRDVVGNGYPVGPGPTPSTMLIKSLRDPAERGQAAGSFVLHDAAADRAWQLGSHGTELQDARAGKVVYLQHQADGSATVHVAELIVEMPEK